MQFLYACIAFILLGVPGKCQDDDGCGETVYKADRGNVRSPNFPNDYPNYARCGWFIALLSPGRIGLTFEKFSLESDSNCDFDYLQVYDGPDVASPLLGRFCGDDLPTVHPTGDSLYLKLITDGSITKSGFSASWFPLYCDDLGGVCNATCSIGGDLGMDCRGTSDMCCQVESSSSTHCSSSWLKECADGSCLYRHEECPEEACPGWKPNRCFGSDSCYNEMEACDGIADCSSGSDEWNCDVVYPPAGSENAWIYVVIICIMLVMGLIVMMFFRSKRNARIRRHNRQRQQLTSIINGGDGPISVYHISGHVNVAANPPSYDEIIDNTTYLPAPPAYGEVSSPTEPDPGLPSYEAACQQALCGSGLTNSTILAKSLQKMPPHSVAGPPPKTTTAPARQPSVTIEIAASSPAPSLGASASPQQDAEVLQGASVSEQVTSPERRSSTTSA